MRAGELNRLGKQSTPWQPFCPRPTFLLGHTPTLLHRTVGGLPITHSASWSHSWDCPHHSTPPTPRSPPPQPSPPQPSPHPAWLSQGDHRHNCSHRVTESQTFESDFWPISPSKDSSRPALLCLWVSHLCLWVGPAAFLRASVFSSAGNLSPHKPTGWSGGDHWETGCGSGGLAGGIPLSASPVLAAQCQPLCGRISMLVILLNCVTLGMFRPCEDIACDSQRCRILQAFDDFIFAFFAVEMVVKMVALGIFGKKCYLGDTWNRLDFFIVIAGMLEYSLDLQNVSFSAVRTVRVLRPLRAINRVPSMRILVTLLLDTLPMLGNVLLLCFFVFFIFGIVGVQLWAGLLRNRCFLPENFSLPLSVDLERYYQTENEDENPFICSQPRENGMRSCRSVPTLRGEGGGGPPCGLDYEAYNSSSNTTCVNWNQYYTNCSAGEHNPFKGAINFDNIGYAWIAIFQVGQPGHWDIPQDASVRTQSSLGVVVLRAGRGPGPLRRPQEALGMPPAESACPSVSSPGHHAGGLGRHHVLRDGCSFLLQFHLLHPPHHRE
uniref:Ion transport domain-containing protein n=1 Tax=Ursus maritimus TaxID=29073 RepID=A0A452UGN5_URSMA